MKRKLAIYASLCVASLFGGATISVTGFGAQSGAALVIADSSASQELSRGDSVGHLALDAHRSPVSSYLDSDLNPASSSRISTETAHEGAQSRLSTPSLARIAAAQSWPEPPSLPSDRSTSTSILQGTRVSSVAGDFPSSSSGVSASLVAARTSGAAPLAVFFDATGSTCAPGCDAFKDVIYSFNFGDQTSGTWAVSKLSKNTQTGGPIAAHVFETPGSFTVTLSAGGSTKTVQILVGDPARAYAGAKTICVSPSKIFSDGCPAGAKQQTGLPGGTNWSGLRVLLHAGESYDAIDIEDPSNNVRVGVYGAGAKPFVTYIAVGANRPQSYKFAADIVVQGLATKTDVHQDMGKQILFMQNSITNGCLYFGDISGWGYWDQQYRVIQLSDAVYNPEELFFVENSIVGTSSVGCNAFGWGARMAWMGNVLNMTRYHNLRVTDSFKSFYAHNAFMGNLSESNYHNFKLHSGQGNASKPTTAQYNDAMLVSGPGWISRYNVIANNTFSSATDNAGWKTAFCPENDQYEEQIQDLIVENNVYSVSRANGGDLFMGGSRMTSRGNKRADGARLMTGTCHTGALPPVANGPYYWLP